MLDRIIKLITSLKLTVVCLGLGLVLVFVGTLAQVDQGLYQAQTRFFKSFFIYWTLPGAAWKIPVFPGGYLVGTVLLLNLIAAHISRFKLTRKKAGILMIHTGLILLLLGQLLTDVLSRESAMRLGVGETKNYSQDFRANELVVIDTSNPASDRVVSIPESRLVRGEEISLPELPVKLHVLESWENSTLFDGPTTNAIAVKASHGIGTKAYLAPLKPTVSENERNLPSALIEVVAPSGSLGSWLVTSQTATRQQFEYQGKTYQIALRFTRYYNPYNLTLVDCTHEIYKGTDTPKNFSSRVRVDNPVTKEDREVLIYMNNPLRYSGTTYYQFQMSEPGRPKESTLQVVTNPTWLTPYFSCGLVGFGMVVQFLTHLFGFIKRRNP